MEHMLQLGVARKVITPEIGGRLFGYQPDVRSESVHDDLTVTAFYFVDGDTQALMVSATVCLIKTALCEEICSLIEQKFGIPKENCIISATHTHSGPAMTEMVGWGGVDVDYYENIFLPALLDAVQEAKEKATPVKMGVASGRSEIGINRRQLYYENQVGLGQNPWGPYNPQMVVMSFVDLEGRHVANMVHYGLHGTCAGMNHEISRDWSGIMIDAMEDMTDGITAFFNGPEGDVGPRLTNGLTTGDITYVERHGGVAASDAMKICNEIRAYRDAKLSVHSEVIEIPLDHRVDYEVAKAEYEKYKAHTINIFAGKANYYKKQMELYEQGYVEQASKGIRQTIIRIGDVAFVSFPYELFSEVGMRIAAHSDIPYTLSLSNANGSEGYFVTEDQICRGGYEVEMFKTGNEQPYVDNADWHLMVQTLKHLEKL